MSREVNMDDVNALANAISEIIKLRARVEELEASLSRLMRLMINAN